MKKITALVPVALLVAITVAAGTLPRVYMNVNRYSISPLEDYSDSTQYVTLSMYLIPSEEFAPNVNVTIQPYSGTIRDYVDISHQQLKAFGFSILRETTLANEAVFEYTGLVDQRNLRFYARAVANKGKVYLITATATRTQWSTVASKLKTCVDSFRAEQ